jgi:TIR domain
MIFVTYRRIDSAAAAGRIYDRLVNEFGRPFVFMDVEGSIPHGADFPTEIQRALDASTALLVVIGRQWMTCTDDRGRPRITNEDDWVANEIASAFDRKVLILPVLVDGASMPAETALPARIAALSRRQASDIRASSWDYDLQRIIATLTPVVRSRARRRVKVLALSVAAAGLIILSIAMVMARGFIANLIDRQRGTTPESVAAVPLHDPANPASGLTTPTPNANKRDDPSTKPAAPVPETRPDPAPAVPVPPGVYSVDFVGLTGANRSGFSGTESNGFRVTPLTRNWEVVTGYGNPAPFIWFMREANETKPMSGTVSIAASGQEFLFESVDVYSSVEKTPYVLTGYVGERTVFKVAGVAPNTFGKFARVDNSEKSRPVDRLSITLETYTESAIQNPTGLDNIVLRIVTKHGAAAVNTK